MADEFTPEASVDFEAMAAAAAAEAMLNGNGDGPHYPPPPEQPAAPPPPIRPISDAPRTRAPQGGDPFAQLEAVARDLPLIYRELGDINVALMRVQLTNILALGSAVLLALLVWKLASNHTVTT